MMHLHLHVPKVIGFLPIFDIISPYHTVQITSPPTPNSLAFLWVMTPRLVVIIETPNPPITGLILCLPFVAT
jgi:hypothetical protein